MFIMQKIIHSNGRTYKFVNRLFIFSFFYCFNFYGEKRNNFLLQFNRYNHGGYNLYLRLFKNYSFELKSNLKNL